MWIDCDLKSLLGLSCLASPARFHKNFLTMNFKVELVVIETGKRVRHFQR